MISALTWIPQGAARERPIRYELSEEEVKIMLKAAQADQDAPDAVDDIERQGPLPASEEEDISDLPPALRMDRYDEDDESDADPGAAAYAEDEDGNEMIEEEEATDEMQEAAKAAAAIGAGVGIEAGDESEHMRVLQIGPRMYAVDAPGGGQPRGMEGEEDDEDEEDDRIKPTDNVLVTAVTTQEEQSELQVWVLTGAEGAAEDDDEGSSFYLHHDIVLPEIPLCLAWMDIPPFRTADGQQSGVGSYMAVGTFACGIEIWNLDVLDPLEPTATLGGELGEGEEYGDDDEDDEDDEHMGQKAKKSSKSKSKGKKGKGKGKKKSKRRELQSRYRPGSHTASVMGMSWNTLYRQALASASADKTVKVWDVTTQTCLSTFTHHADKVQAVRWHPSSASLLATGSFDKTICLVDCLQAQAAAAAGASNACASGVVATFGTDQLVDPLTGVTFGADVESMQWNPHNDNELFVALENGYVVCFDRRQLPAQGVVSRATTRCFQAHAKTTASLAFSRTVPGMLCTASVDKTVRIWDTNANTNTSGVGAGAGVGVPRCVAYKSMGIGKVLAADYSYSQSHVVAGAPVAVSGAADAVSVDLADLGFLLACGGDGNDGAPAVWYSDELSELKEHFGSKRGGSGAGGVIEDTTPGACAGTSMEEGSSGVGSRKKNKNKNKNKQ